MIINEMGLFNCTSRIETGYDLGLVVLVNRHVIIHSREHLLAWKIANFIFIFMVFSCGFRINDYNDTIVNRNFTIKLFFEIRRPKSRPKNFNEKWNKINLVAHKRQMQKLTGYRRYCCRVVYRFQSSLDLYVQIFDMCSWSDPY